MEVLRGEPRGSSQVPEILSYRRLEEQGGQETDMGEQECGRGYPWDIRAKKSQTQSIFSPKKNFIFKRSFSLRGSFSPKKSFSPQKAFSPKRSFSFTRSFSLRKGSQGESEFGPRTIRQMGEEEGGLGEEEQYIDTWLR